MFDFFGNAQKTRNCSGEYFMSRKCFDRRCHTVITLPYFIVLTFSTCYLEAIHIEMSLSSTLIDKAPQISTTASALEKD